MGPRIVFRFLLLRVFSFGPQLPRVREVSCRSSLFYSRSSCFHETRGRVQGTERVEFIQHNMGSELLQDYQGEVAESVSVFCDGVWRSRSEHPARVTRDKRAWLKL